jgi:hypothetical protein
MGKGVPIAVLVAGAWVCAAQGRPDAREIVQQSVLRDQSNFQLAKDYTFIRREEIHRLDGGGKTESNTFDVTILGDRPYAMKIAHNDKPLPEKAAREARERFDREVAKRQKESPEERRKQLEQHEKSQAESRAFMREIPDAFNFKLAGEERIDDIAVWVIEATPRAGYRGHAKNWEMLAKFRGRMSIAKDSLEWVRIEAETVAPVSFGWILARLKPGTRITFEQRRVNGEVWLPQRMTMHLDARLALVKGIRADINIDWKNYRKFGSDSRVVSAEELPAAPRP